VLRKTRNLATGGGKCGHLRKKKRGARFPPEPRGKSPPTETNLAHVRKKRDPDVDEKRMGDRSGSSSRGPSFRGKETPGASVRNRPSVTHAQRRRKKVTQRNRLGRKGGKESRALSPREKSGPEAAARRKKKREGGADCERKATNFTAPGEGKHPLSTRAAGGREKKRATDRQGGEGKKENRVDYVEGRGL